ncbi:MAG: hypothetical protein FJ088_01260 [Deltaproteobacteria bacterium]|nr:hypothetical protein [Deltaproteobacteria bacterium]
MKDKIFVRNISEDTWKNLKARAALNGCTISKALEDAIKLWLAKERQNKPRRIDWKKITGLYDGGYADASEKHDEYLAESRLKRMKKR